VRELRVETQRLPMIRWTRLEETLREHVDLLAKIKAKNAAGAEKAMKHHIRSAAQRIDIELQPERADKRRTDLAPAIVRAAASLRASVTDCHKQAEGQMTVPKRGRKAAKQD
jgi:hypothetical protein